jgi:hypothetical protein
MVEKKFRRVARFHRDAVTSGGKTGVALASVITLVLGGSVTALTVWLANVSWVIAALVGTASLFFFYAWGAYRVWDKAQSAADETHVQLDTVQRERDDAHRELEASRNAPIPALVKPAPPPFEVRYYSGGPSPDWAGTAATGHYIGVTNPAGQPERRVRMSVERVDPQPPGVKPRLPYSVPPASGGNSAIGVVIGPGQEESWLIGDAAIYGDGQIVLWSFYGEMKTGGWPLSPNEHWRLSYRIDSEGIPNKQFSIVLGVEDGNLVVRLEDPDAHNAVQDSS